MTHLLNRQRQISRPLMIAILTFSMAHSLIGQDIAPASPTASSVDSSGQPLKIMGLDLSDAKFARSEKDVPDLYEKSGKQQPDMFIMPLEKLEPAATAAQPKPPSNESSWLKYATSVSRFYIEYRSDRNKPETERIYGPFAGDPFERFRLEPMIAARLRGGYSPNDILSIGRMLKTQNATLSKRALRLAEAAIECKDSAIVENVIREIRQILNGNAATIEKLDLQTEKLALEQKISAAETELEKLVVEIPNEQYAKPADSKNALPGEIPNDAWGQAINGLRAAAVPKQSSVAMGAELPVTLVLENTSDHDIKFSFSDVVQSARAEVQDGNRKTLQTQTTWFSGWAPVQRFALKPGESVSLANVSLKFADKNGGNPGIGCTQIIDAARGGAAISEYRIRYTVPLATGSSWRRGEDGVMRRISPAKGEWNGTLTSEFGSVKVAAQ